MRELTALFLVIASAVAILANAAQAEDAMFPLLRGMAGDEVLPSPFGIAVTAYEQTQGYNLKDLTLIPLDDAALNALNNLGSSLPSFRLRARSQSIPVPTPPDLPDTVPPGALLPALIENIGIDNRLTETDVQLDLWVLPFLNVYALAGRIDGTTRVDLRDIVGMTMKIDYDGLVYGFGAVLCYGIDRYFASVNTTVTQTDLSTSSSTVGAWIVMPQVGMQVPWGAIWLGAMYQKADETHEGAIGGESGRLYYDVALEDTEPWNYLCGFRIDFRGDWHADLQLGAGDRRHAQASLSYRF